MLICSNVMLYIWFRTRAGIAQLSEFISFVIIPKKVLTMIGECRIYTNKIRYLPSSVASTQPCALWVNELGSHKRYSHFSPILINQDTVSSPFYFIIYLQKIIKSLLSFKISYQFLYSLSPLSFAKIFYYPFKR